MGDPRFNLSDVPHHHGLHVWLTEEMGFTFLEEIDTYKHPTNGWMVNGEAIRAITAGLADVDAARAAIADAIFTDPDDAQ